MHIQDITHDEPFANSNHQAYRTPHSDCGDQRKSRHDASRQTIFESLSTNGSETVLSKGSQERSGAPQDKPNDKKELQPIHESPSASGMTKLHHAHHHIQSSQRSQLCPQPQQNRQIKFVSLNGLPQTKRKRIQNACRACRRRKVRCSGERPTCKTCSDHGHICDGYAEPKIYSDGLEVPLAPKVEHRRDSDGVSNLSDVPIPSALAGNVQKREIKRLKSNSENDNDHQRSKGTSNNRQLQPFAHTHVPYFRYFGPTAILPGYKQTVVQVRNSRRSFTSSATSSIQSQSSSPNPSLASRESKVMTIEESFYTIEDDREVSELVLHLCDVFFTSFGCNFPFLQRHRFMRDLKAKKIEPILVDAICAVAARFSLHPLLIKVGQELHAAEKCRHRLKTGRTTHTHHGQPFAQRAMVAVVEALDCPTLAVVQACLLIAYEQFGSNKDSGLWNYLGIAIRMAQDLGIQKVKGLKHRYGRLGLRPKDVLCGSEYTAEKVAVFAEDEPSSDNQGPGKTQGQIEEEALERERVDTFWSIFFLDRVISSGTGRPVTLLDGDLEIAFPLNKDSLLPGGLPSPFPMLLRVIHLYGRITDLLNGIEESSHVSSEILERLMNIEKDLTGVYQLLSPRLHFNVVNFQNYVKAGEGTDFILLHFWFHTLIVLLHQPTLLHSFGEQMQRLVPNTKELSISSAKTIVDILAFAELIDAKSFIGNPFTSQPIYISACAFLAEQQNNITGNVPHQQHTPREMMIASSPQENYQKCYGALKHIKLYWEGCRYIIAVLDQKAKGIVDPQLFTDEEWDGAIMESFTTPLTKAAVSRASNESKPSGSRQVSREGDTTNESSTDLMQLGATQPSNINLASGQAIGWALTGATGLEQPNVSFLYQIPASSEGASSAINSRTLDANTNAVVNAGRENTVAMDVSPSTQYSHQQRRHAHWETVGYEGRYTTSNGEEGYNHYIKFNQQDNHHRYRGLMDHTEQSMTVPAYPADIGDGATMDIGMQDVNFHDLYNNIHVSQMSKGAIGKVVPVHQADHHQRSPSLAIGGELMPLLDYLPADVLSYFGQESGEEDVAAQHARNN